MKLRPYIRFDGRCREAFGYYRALPGGKILTMTTYDGSPGEEFVGPEWHDKIFHATLAIGDQASSAWTPRRAVSSPYRVSP
jgi:PhnB protein